MRQLSAGQFPAQIVLMTTVASMKWLFIVVVATRRRFYACDRKENGTIFGDASRLFETTLRSLLLNMTFAAQVLRNVDWVFVRGNSLHTREFQEF